jgi:predicted HicB family RNase H-like nuclease
VSYRARSDESADDQAQLSIRVPVMLRERLQKEAARRTVSLNLLAQRALEECLTKWEKQKLP